MIEGDYHPELNITLTGIARLLESFTLPIGRMIPSYGGSQSTDGWRSRNDLTKIKCTCNI